MLYSICPACQHHNRISTASWDSILSEWTQQHACAVCDTRFTAGASKSFIAPVHGRKIPGL